MPYNYMDSLPPPQGQMPQSPMPQGVQPGMTPGMVDPTQQQQNRLGIDPALLAAWLGTYGDQLEMDQLEKQVAQANALRDAPGPEGRDSGRVYTAANPLEHIGAAMQKIGAIRDEKRLREGVRNPGYGPGVTATPQPEYSQEGIAQKIARIKDSVRGVGQGYLGK